METLGRMAFIRLKYSNFMVSFSTVDHFLYRFFITVATGVKRNRPRQLLAGLVEQ